MADENLIECNNHQLRPWYVCCKHLMQGAPLGHFIEASPNKPGEALCIPCSQGSKFPPMEQLAGVCDKCMAINILKTTQPPN